MKHEIENTIKYYNENIQKFVANTIDVTFDDTQNRFLNRLDKGAKILDFGCGAGRDTKYFLTQGYHVDAIDGSKELCRYASQFTGIKVNQMLFQELKEINQYDGIWACSSILHLNKATLEEVLNKMLTALKKEGIIYTSFKYGYFEGERNGRYFTDFTESEFIEYLKKIDGITLEEYWITSDVRPDRSDEKWLNLILQKK